MTSAANRKKHCVFCQTFSLETDLGSFYRISPYNFHSNCLIFSSNIRQNEDRTKGLNGFEKKSIDYTLNEAKNENCNFCKKKGATLKCSGNENLTCEVSFHLPCALKSKTTLHEYFDGYKSYCLEHISRKCRFDNEPITGIACNVTCCKQLYSHDECLENYVLETKSQLKCPVCKKVKDFVRFMKTNYDMKIGIGETSLDTGTDTNLGYHKNDIVMIQCLGCQTPFGIHRTYMNIAGKSEWRCKTCNIQGDLDEPGVETGTKIRKQVKLEPKKKKK